MASGTIKKSSLYYEGVISNFDSNNSEWTAPQDGFVVIKANQVLNGMCYVYLFSNQIVRASIVCKDGTGGLTYTACTPVMKNVKYTLVMGGYTEASVFFYSLH